MSRLATACPCGGVRIDNKCERCNRSEGRDNAHRRGYTTLWSKAREAYLVANPSCAECEREGRGLVRATVVDHIVPHRGEPVLFWERGNWQPLCSKCHNQKTRRGE